MSDVVIFSYSSMNILYSYFESEYGICFHIPFGTLGSFAATGGRRRPAKGGPRCHCHMSLSHAFFFVKMFVMQAVC